MGEADGTICMCLSSGMFFSVVMEMSLCFADARDDPKVGVIILTGEESRGE